MKFRVTVLPGDGIGPEVTAEAVRVLQTVAGIHGYKFEFEEHAIGGVAIREFGSPLPRTTLDACLASDAVLLGAVGAALTLGARGGGSLLALLVLPLYAPVLIFGAGAVDAVRAGVAATPHLSLLAAGLLLAIVAAPFAVSAAVRIALD
jgi:hypothetical protein